MKTRRCAYCVTGVILTACAVALMKHASLGLDPFQTLLFTVSATIPIGYGTLSMLLNGILLGVAFFFGRQYVGIHTFINLFLLGYMVEFFNMLLQTLLPAPSFLSRFLMLAAGLVLLCGGNSLYTTAEVGVSAYDSIALILSEVFHLGRFQRCRILTDAICVICSLSLLLLMNSGKWIHYIGFGTVSAVWLTGPLIHRFRQLLPSPLAVHKEHPSG